MIRTIRYWVTLALFTFVVGYSISKGFSYIFSSSINLILSIMVISFFDLATMSVLSRGKDLEVDRKSLPWIVSHNKLYKFPVLILILISQLSIFSYFLSPGESFKSGLLIILVFLAIIFAGTVLLGKRK